MRLIDADALMDAMRDNEFQTFCPLDEVDDVIANAPTLDYAPVKRGRFGFVGGSAISVYVNFGTCSECKERVAWYQHKNYCPNCGAKMDAQC